ncbi:MAG: DUF4625 domain-containing protein [Flavobacteriales bacterium]|nr:DUF4625 domain-containing protein [Flavobacteriales bacterium]
MNFSTLRILAIAIALSTSCKKKEDPDTTPPSITVQKPAADAECTPGAQLEFEAIASDDKELSELLVEIHSDLDDHKHESSRSAQWETRSNFYLSGRIQSVSNTFEIPADADTGSYHFVVYVLDKAGNRGPLVERDIKLSAK